MSSDREAIEDVLAGYTRFGDGGRLEQMAALFADDGILEVGADVVVGPTAILEFFRATGQRFADAGDLLPAGHHVSSRWIEVDGDGARSGSRFLFVGAQGVDHWGTYRDELRKVEGSWRIARRRVRTDGFAEGSRLRPA